MRCQFQELDSYLTEQYYRSNSSELFFYNLYLIFSGNVTSIIVLFRKDMELKRDFMHILVTLICFDILCIVFNLMIFGFPRLWESYEQKVWPYIIPTVLPLAQIALTGMISLKNVVGRPSYVQYNFQYNTITLHYTILSITSILQSIILRLSLPIILCQIHPKSINIFTYLFIFFRIYLQYLSIGY